MSGISQKHFEAIAEILNQTRRWIEDNPSSSLYDKEEKSLAKRTTEEVADRLCDYFATENAGFDRQRFKEAVFRGCFE